MIAFAINIYQFEMRDMMKKYLLLFIFIISTVFLNNVHANTNNATLVLLKEENLETAGTIITAKIPQIINVKDEKVKNDINTLINQTIDNFLNESKKNDENPDSKHKVIVDITYQNYYSDDKIISFSIDFTQSMADSYLQKKFFTIDLITGEIYQIEHFLGENYQNIILNAVKQQVAANKEKYPNLAYFDEAINNLKITSDQAFYINKNNQIVVVFNQYEIAPGYVSLPEFIIK